MRVIVLDTNCLLQSLPSRSPYHKIWTEVLSGRIRLCVNTEILNEYEEVLSQKTTPEIAHNVVEAIARLHTTIYQEVYVHFGLIKEDVDDNKFVDCAGFIPQSRCEKSFSEIKTSVLSAVRDVLDKANVEVMVTYRCPFILPPDIFSILLKEHITFILHYFQNILAKIRGRTSIKTKNVKVESHFM